MSGAVSRAGAAVRVPIVWLHIGLNKTGTTSLQNLFAAHRDTLLRHGVLYPVSGIHANAHHWLSWLCGFHQGPAPAADFTAERLSEQLKAEFRQAPGATVLLSSEFMSVKGDIARLVQLLKPADVRVIVYLRRHDTWLQSVYVQAVKTVLQPKWGRGMTSYLKAVGAARNVANYRTMLDDWARHVGAENIVVRPFERSQMSGALHQDLLRAMGCHEAADALPAELPRENESVSYEAVNLIDIAAHTRLPESAKAWIRDSVLRHDPGTQRGVAYLSPQDRLAMLRAREDDYAHIARTWLGREDGRLFHDPLPDASAPWTPPVHPTAMWIADRFAAYLSLADPKVLAAIREKAGELVTGQAPAPAPAPAPSPAPTATAAGTAPVKPAAKAAAKARR
jgi:hypothetical protein